MISIYYGTRPEYIKIKLLYDKMLSSGLAVELVRVNQHTTLIEDCYCDRQISVGCLQSNRLNAIVSSCLEDGIIHKDCDLVVVQGDTATAFAIAIHAFHSKIKIAHIEAGLRTYDNDNPYPEEAYRKCISVVSSYNFCVTENNALYLKNEHAHGKIFVVGNTSLDNIVGLTPSYGDTVLITLHRRENKELMRDWFVALEECASKNVHLKFIFPIHPSPEVMMHRHLLKTVQVVEPMKHNDLLSLLSTCKFIITDSGGIQEESSFLKKKSIVCRKTTERQEGIDIFSFLCFSPNLLENIINTIDYQFEIDAACPYGDGTATDKILLILKKELYND